MQADIIGIFLESLKQGQSGISNSSPSVSTSSGSFSTKNTGQPALAGISNAAYNPAAVDAKSTADILARQEKDTSDTTSPTAYTNTGSTSSTAGTSAMTDATSTYANQSTNVSANPGLQQAATIGKTGLTLAGAALSTNAIAGTGATAYTGAGLTSMGEIGTGTLSSAAPVTNFTGQTGAYVTSELAPAAASTTTSAGITAGEELGTTLGSAIGGIATGVGYAALGNLGRKIVGTIAEEFVRTGKKGSVDEKYAQGFADSIADSPTIEGAPFEFLKGAGVVSGDTEVGPFGTIMSGGVFTPDKTMDQVETVLDPVGSILKSIGTVICTELHRQGILSDEVYRQDIIYGQQQDDDLLNGYRLLANPVVRLMQRSSVVTKIVSLVAIPWSEQMCGRDNFIGRMVFKIYPLVRFIGKTRRILWQYRTCLTS